MKRIQQLKEQRANLLARAEALVKLAEEENRSLTEDEAKEVDGISSDGGELSKVDAELKRLERVQSLQAEAAIRIAGQQRQEPEGRRIVVPATARKLGNFKAFKGADAEVDAYASGQWILASVFKNERSRQWCSDHGIEIRGSLSESSNSAGGFLVPTQLESAIITLLQQYGVARQYCDVYPMSSDTAIIPRRSSGLTAYFVGDNTEITASDIAWDQVSLNARKLAALCKYSSELAEDAVTSIADRIADEVAYAFAVKEDQCAFLGDGTSTYGHMTGIKNALAAGSVYTAITGNTAFSTLDMADFEGMVGMLPVYPGIQPAWFISKAGWAASMMRLLDAAGGATISELQGGKMPMFLGYPVVFTQVMNATLTAQTSTAGLVHFGDLRLGVTLGSRRGINMAASTDRYFEYDTLAVKGTERFDVNVHGIGTASAAGPIISMTTPGS